MPKDPAKKEEITSDLSWRKWEASRGTRMEKYERGMETGDFQIGRMGFCLDGKKGKKGELPNGEIEKGMTSAHPEIGNQPWTFKGIKAEKRERMKKQEIEPAE